MTKAALYIGHGKSTDDSWDPGTTWNGLTEAGLMLPIGQAAARSLETSGVEVLTDAFSGNNINMIKQVAEANAQGADVFVSLHCDWYKTPSGTMPLYISDNGKALANAINRRVMEATGLDTRGLIKRTDLYELKQTKMPACVYETGSIDDDSDVFMEMADAYGQAIAWGICDYLGVTFKAADPLEPVADNELRVDGLWSVDTTKKTQKALGTPEDGTVSSQPVACKKYLPNCYAASWKFAEGNTSGSPMVKAIQELVGEVQDGKFGYKTAVAVQKFLAGLGLYEGEIDGYVGKLTVMAWQKYINSILA